MHALLVAMLFTRGVKVRIYSHIVGTSAACITSGIEYLSMYLPHLLTCLTFSKELFRSVGDNHALNEIL